MASSSPGGPGSNTTIARNGGVVIGGNAFSDTGGAPSSSFVPPQYGGGTAGSASGSASGDYGGGGDYPGAYPNASASNMPGIDSPISPNDPSVIGPDFGGGSGLPSAPGVLGNPTPGTTATPATGLPQIGSFLADIAVRAGLVVLGIVLISAAAKALAGGETGAQATVANLRPSELFPTVRKL